MATRTLYVPIGQDPYPHTPIRAAGAGQARGRQEGGIDHSHAPIHAHGRHFRRRERVHGVLEMPGTDKNHVDINVEAGVLTIDGRLDFSKYEGMQPVYTEYNIGHYRRSFSLPNKIDQNRIGRDEGWRPYHHSAQSRGGKVAQDLSELSRVLEMRRT